MKATYNELKSSAILPPGSRYVDPFDHESFFPIPKESFSEFISRIKSSRERKGLPAISNEDLELLVVHSLHETSDPNFRHLYFEEKRINPLRQQALSFVKAAVSMLTNPTAISVKQRQDRAVNYCLKNCPLHDRGGSVLKKKIVSLVGKIIGIEDTFRYPEESGLGSCRACGCSLSAKTQVSTEAALVSIGPDNLDEILKVHKTNAFHRCWILKESLESQRLTSVLEKKLALTRNSGLDHLKTHRLAQAELEKRRLNGKKI